MSRCFSLPFFIILLLFNIDNTNAQKMRAELFAEPESLRIGDRLKITLELQFDDDTQFQLPDLRVELLPIELGDESISRERGKKGIRIERHIFESFIFDTGQIVIPSQKIVYWLAPDSTTQLKTYTDSLWLYVQSVLSADAVEIRDIKEPNEIPQPFDNWGTVIAIIAFLLVIGIAYYMWRKKADKPIIPFKKSVEIRPAHEIALESLKQLNNKNLIEKKQVDRYYMGLSRILREYIENRYFLKALEMTTTEMLALLEKDELYKTIGDTVQEVLTNSDLVKFARFIPEDSFATFLMEKTLKLVEDTKIVSETAELTEEPLSGILEEKKD